VRIDTDVAASVVKNEGLITGPFEAAVDARNVNSGANTTVRDVTISGPRHGVRFAKTVENIIVSLTSAQSGSAVSQATTVQGCTISAAVPGTHTGIFAAQLVTGNTLLDLETGMSHVYKASGNVVQSSVECTGIKWYPTFATDYVRDNYVRCPGPDSLGIYVYSAYNGTDEGPELESNLIRVEGTGIEGLTGKAHVFKNLFVINGLSVPIVPPLFGPWTVEPDNLCGDPTYCIWPPQAPFSL
jgi:hypothetical protein